MSAPAAPARTAEPGAGGAAGAHPTPTRVGAWGLCAGDPRSIGLGVQRQGCPAGWESREGGVVCEVGRGWPRPRQVPREGGAATQ